MSTLFKEIKTLELFSNSITNSFQYRNNFSKALDIQEPKANEILMRAELENLINYLVKAKINDEITFENIDFVYLFEVAIKGIFNKLKHNDRTFLCILILVLKMSYHYGKEETEWNLLINNEEILNTLIKDAICSIV